MNERAESIYVYDVEPPERLAEAAETLARVVFGMDGVDDGDRHLAVSPLSGHVTFLDDSALWQGSADLGGDAAATARAFLSKAAGSLSRQGAPGFFPQRPETLGTYPAVDPGRGAPDHWLVRFGARLEAGGDPAAAPAAREVPVDGAWIDVHVAADGSAVIGLVSRWRPWKTRRLVPRLPRPPQTPGTPGGRGGDGPSPERASSGAPLLTYVIDGEDEPQAFIAPYYVSFTDDGQTLSPASEYSPVVTIRQERTGDGVKLSAVVEGTQGPLRYAWGATRLDVTDEGGFNTLGSDSSISLGPGVHDVVLDVRDSRTGAICRRGAVVYVLSPAAGEA